MYLEGSLRTRKWEKDGVTRYSTEVIADKMQMLGGKRDDDGNNFEPESNRHDNQPPPSQDKSQPASAGAGAFDDFDDDIPF